MSNSKELRRMESSPSLDFRMHYGSIVGMTQFYRPPCSVVPKKQDRKSLVSFAKKDDIRYFDADFPVKSVSCPNFNYDPTEEEDVVEIETDFAPHALRATPSPKQEDKRTCLVANQENEENQPKVAETKEVQSEAPPKKRRSVISQIKKLREIRSRLDSDCTNSGSNGASVKSMNRNSQDAAVLIERKTNTGPKQNSTLKQDRRQLGGAQNMVAARRAMFERLVKTNAY